MRRKGGARLVPFVPSRGGSRRSRRREWWCWRARGWRPWTPAAPSSGALGAASRSPSQLGLRAGHRRTAERKGRWADESWLGSGWLVQILNSEVGRPPQVGAGASTPYSPRAQVAGIAGRNPATILSRQTEVEDECCLLFWASQNCQNVGQASVRLLAHVGRAQQASAHHTDAHSSCAALLGTSVLLILLKKNYVLLIGQTPDCYFIVFDILIFFII